MCRSLFLLAALVAACTAITVPAQKRAMVKTFETVHPQIIQKSRHARDVHPQILDVQITSDSDTFTLRLTLNNKLIAPQFASIHFEEDGKEITVTDQPNCFYHGEVLEHPEWKIAIDSCQGLRGSFGDWGNKTRRFNIEPLNENDNSLEQPHALYQADGSEEEGECGTTHEHHEDSTNPLNLSEEELDRARRQSSSGARIIELAVVSDRSQYTYYRNDMTSTVSRALALANVADRIYQQLNIRVVVVRSIVWTSGDRSQFNPSPETTLRNFRTHTLTLQNQFSYDAIVLLTGNDFTANTVGIAYLSTMCGSDSVGVVQDRHSSSTATGSTLAHEIGHLLSMGHDTAPCSCNDPSGRCVMASVTGVPPEMWSSCSRSAVNSFSRGSCLYNEPTNTVGPPQCGNGIREGNEICDCGRPEECDDPCCDGRTCRLAAGAQCRKGECCSNTCRFLGSNTVCRGSAGQCDMAETCTGQSADCPVDAFIQNGSPCNNNQAYCFSGQCKTYNAQCQKHFRTNKGVDECFTSYNPVGNYFGNCGTDGSNFIPCATSDVMCGQLFCEQGTYQNRVNSVYIIEVGVYIPSTSGVRQCIAFTPPPTSDIMSPGLVDDGVKCGSGKMCYEQRCRAINDLNIPQCPSGSNGRVCSGNGVCNSRGECSCDSGYSGRTCTSSTSVNECLNNNGGCAHTCVDTSTSYRCECRSGYQLASNGRSCTDINECSGNHRCAQVCTNTVGSYTCSCNTNYRLGSDGRSCTLIPTSPPTVAAPTCGGRLTGTSGTFQTPGWPRDYPQADFQCEWMIAVPVRGYRIRFTIDSSAYGINGSPPCTDDYLEFFDGVSTSANSLQKLCKFNKPSPIMTSSSEARVVFAGSENSQRPASRVGARISYIITDIDECTAGTHGCQQQCQNTAGSYTCSCGTGYTLDSNGRTCTLDSPEPTSNGLCGGRLTGTSGSFQSPGYPTSYPDSNLQCIWTIEAPSPSNTIFFTIDNSPFGINGRPPCNNDYIEFFDGISNNANSVAKVCGLLGFYSNQGGLPTIHTTASSSRIVFSASDANRPLSRVGVRVNYWVV